MVLIGICKMLMIGCRSIATPSLSLKDEVQSGRHPSVPCNWSQSHTPCPERLIEPVLHLGVHVVISWKDVAFVSFAPVDPVIRVLDFVVLDPLCSIMSSLSDHSQPLLPHRRVNLNPLIMVEVFRSPAVFWVQHVFEVVEGKDEGRVGHRHSWLNCIDV